MKALLFTLFLIYTSLNLIAQNNCTNEVSTNFDTPTNSELPNTDTPTDPFTQDDPRFLNAFDWTSTNSIQLQNMQQNQNMLYLHNASAPYYSYLYNGEEMTPENGWELMLYNVGTYPDLSNNPDGQNTDIPYIALYNKFTGILRVFAVYGDGFLPTGISFDGVLVKLRFDNYNFVSGNFRLSSGKDVALDKTTSALQTTSTALHTNSPNKWFSADFQLTYDPCVCYYPSDIRLQFDFLERMELNLYGRSITVTDNIADGNNLLTNNFLSNFQFSGTTSDDQIIMYAVMADFVDDYIAKLQKYKDDLVAIQEYNKEIDEKLFIAKLFKGVILDGVGFAVSSFTGLPWFTSGAQLISKYVPPLGTSDKDLDRYREKLKKAASSIFGKKVDSFIEKNFEKKKTPSKPGAPMASFEEFRMTGEILSETSINGSKFYTPGTYGSLGTGTPTIINPAEYPIYNNAVGIFALLNTPKIKAFKSAGEVVDEFWLYNTKYYSWSRNYQFQLAEDIFYAINDAGIESHDISIGFRVKGEMKSLNSDFSALPPSHNIQSYIDPINTMNLVSDSVETDDYYPLIVNNGLGFNNGSNYCTPDLEALGACTVVEYNLPKNDYSKDTITLTTEYMPLDVISPFVFSLAIMNQMQKYEFMQPLDPGTHGTTFESIELEMLVRTEVVFEQLDENGENITSTYMFAYDMDNIEWVAAPLETDIPNSPHNYDSYEENLLLSTVNFDGSSVDGCKLVGSHYTCHGWDDVTVVGDLTTVSGYTVDILGANEVNVIGESNISPEIVLDIESLLDYSEPMPRADLAFVRDFCNNDLGEGFPAYEADKPNKNAIAEYEAFNEEKPNNETNFELLTVNLYPVPASNLLNVRSSASLSNEQLAIVDFTGRILNLPINKISDRDFQINTSQLATGSYYLTLSSNEGQVKILFTVAKNN